MKLPYQYKTTLFLLVALCMTAMATGCGGDDPSLEELTLNDLSATWQVNNVENDDLDVSDQFNGFMLTVNRDGTFSTTNGSNPWPAQGTYEFSDETIRHIRRDDGVNITIQTLTPTRLTLSFSMTDVRGEANNTDGITGAFIFDLTKTN